MSGSEKKVNKITYDSSSISVTRKFHDVVFQNNGKEIYKKACSRAKLAFC